VALVLHDFDKPRMGCEKVPCSVFADYVRALKHGHEEGYVHRDVFLNNMFVKKHGDVIKGVLSDWCEVVVKGSEFPFAGSWMTMSSQSTRN